MEREVNADQMQRARLHVAQQQIAHLSQYEKISVAQDPMITESQQRALMAHPELGVERSLARNPSLIPELQLGLAKHSDPGWFAT